MFDRIKKALLGGAKGGGEGGDSPSQMSHGPVSEWAQTKGFMVSVAGNAGETVVLSGKVKGRPWKMELGPPTREYIRSDELRARGEIGVDDDVAVLVINRPLKDALEKQAYQMYTDSLQTSADPRLPEEMRWLAMFDEVGWDELPPVFWERYAVLTDKRANALAWIDDELAEQMLSWPRPEQSAEIPFILLLLRGKAYMRMECNANDMPTVQRASQVFTAACESAIRVFGAVR